MPTIKKVVKKKDENNVPSPSQIEFEKFINDKILKHEILADFYKNGEKAEIHEITIKIQPNKSFWDLAQSNITSNVTLDKKTQEDIKNEYDTMLKQIILFVINHTVKEVSGNFFAVETQEYRTNKLKEYYNQANNKVDTFLKCYIGEDSFAKHPEYKNINLANVNPDLKKILNNSLTREAFRLDILNSIIDESLPTLAAALNNELLSTEQDENRRFTLKQSTASATLQKNISSSNKNSASILGRSLTEKNLLAHRDNEEIQIDDERTSATPRMTIRPTDNRYKLLGKSLPKDEERIPFANANESVENNDNWCCNIL
jgi:hypothetical protein